MGNKKSKNKKSNGRIIVIALILLILFTLVKVATNKKITLSANNKVITLNYSSIYFKRGENAETKSNLKSKKEEINVEIKENKLESYNILRDYCIMAYKGENVEYNKIPCFCYCDEINKQYVVISKIDEQKIIEITIKPNDNSNKDVTETFNQKKVQKILKTLKIK